MSSMDTPTTDRRLFREYWKPRVHLSHSKSRQFLSLPMANNLQPFVCTQQTYEQTEGTSASVSLLRRGFKSPHHRIRQSCSLNAHRIATSVLIASLILSALAFLSFPRFAQIQLPRAFQSTIPTSGQSQKTNFTFNESTTGGNYYGQWNGPRSDGYESDVNGFSDKTRKDGFKDSLDNNKVSDAFQEGQSIDERAEGDELTSRGENGHHPSSIGSEGGQTSSHDNRIDPVPNVRDDKEVSAQSEKEESSNYDNSHGVTTKEESRRDSEAINSEENETVESDGNGAHPNKNMNVHSDPADFATFTNITTLNYFHLHKTGGVSFKGRIFKFFFTKGRRKRDGEPVRVVDTCYISEVRRPEMGIEAEWSCNWAKLEAMPAEDRQKIDVIVGHQYWEQGAAYWVPNRDLRYFTVMRHPLHRKISFFYHFFVRNAGRSEDSVDAKEVIAFVLGHDLPRSSLVRDAGPGYYASRLWSDGWSGFGKKHRYEIPESDANDLVAKSIQRLRRHFVFVGLQTQEKASLCMLKKTVLEFARAHGVHDLNGIEDIAAPKERMNTGGYALTASKLWEQMSKSEREKFATVERVDLGIYSECLKMFGEMVRKFGCEAFVEDNDEDSIEI